VTSFGTLRLVIVPVRLAWVDSGHTRRQHEKTPELPTVFARAALGSVDMKPGGLTVRSGHSNLAAGSQKADLLLDLLDGEPA
jgi:hypothetical protein